MRFSTPLRYPGGKAKFAPFVKDLMKANNLTGDYLEPYAGGAGVALDLLFNGYCQNIHINDFDIAVFNFWKSITENTDNFLKMIKDTDVTIDKWHEQKLILNNPDKHSQLEHGFATFFLNRTNRSGILKGGVIGGKNQDGNYKLDARYHKENLSKRIEKIGEYKDRIKVYNLDALELLNQVDFLLPPDSLIYLDPPYYVKGQGLYRNFYMHDDHVQIRQTLDKVQSKWIVSYDNCTEIKEIYSGYRQEDYELNYSAYYKTKGSEVMIYCDKVKPVKVINKQIDLEITG
ncbi:DNA adenine methylase [Acinetobacter terrestris]|uniref:DNA adenine methylase n=1 Tax=Acinetobacter terrestris TaxID=2529843 RepID=UPI00103F98E4|nr:DNA adenine methylase [Acinetobacter terrestris]TCB48416.1 DNA adenine methylase [Acinetobacter terrestris]